MTAINLTPREVAELANAPKRAVEKAIEEKVLVVHKATHAIPFGKAERRFLGMESIAYIRLMRRLSPEVSLTIPAKRKLARSLRTYDFDRLKAARVQLAPALIADIGEAAGDALERAARYVRAREDWIDSVHGIKGGLPVIRGTRLTAHSLAARLDHGDSLEDLVAENPDLPRGAIEAAVVFAKTHPLPGRPARLEHSAA
ncbi:DUF433 domain-containing protein [Rhodoblastus acidophilus]|uniref:DUF433 domain-containing protein n=1 Tax=Candidatus Rhodoblastus alkanivorans TaxID=2954117 RepID=A0ABS9Z2N7_9HYPH|nr:DUF433 domain-containing protein [Candidatus Rhodoblastus alkanivorans]MCI4679040.1 DUF433 domain-containing protein [Candidatus Rhodoblastus alkanivorans]MCI4681705.1 DUF433 domain-containing protein [Candidatus Rhodoblastus alkanivorans]MDI4642753.1 DUF433 domain-containing protein [Rhodoblastus acidophilus]